MAITQKATGDTEEFFFDTLDMFDDKKFLERHQEVLADCYHPEVLLETFITLKGEFYENFKRGNEILRQRGYSHETIKDMNLEAISKFYTLFVLLNSQAREYVKTLSPQRKEKNKPELFDGICKSFNTVLF